MCNPTKAVLLLCITHKRAHLTSLFFFLNLGGGGKKKKKKKPCLWFNLKKNNVIEFKSVRSSRVHQDVVVVVILYINSAGINFFFTFLFFLSLFLFYLLLF
jgi:hypothetical protein